MRRSTCWLLCSLVVGCSSFDQAPGGRSVAADLRAEIEGRVVEMERCMRANDLAGVAAIYADDGLLLSPSGRSTSGRDAIDRYWLGLGKGVDWRLTIDRLEGGKDLVHHRGKSTLTYERDGERRRSVVEFALVWVRQADGVMRIAVDAYW